MNGSIEDSSVSTHHEPKTSLDVVGQGKNENVMSEPMKSIALILLNLEAIPWRLPMRLTMKLPTQVKVPLFLMDRHKTVIQVCSSSSHTARAEHLLDLGGNRM